MLLDTHAFLVTELLLKNALGGIGIRLRTLLCARVW